jgi:hypothetical protein
MQPLHIHKARGFHTSHQRQSAWPSRRAAHRHSYVNSTLFYLSLLAAEVALVGSSIAFEAVGTWPLWKIGSIVLANMFFALVVGNHHVNRGRKHLAADIILAGLLLLMLVALSTFVASSTGGLEILVYAWLCALLLNTLHYYPRKQSSTRKRW